METASWEEALEVSALVSLRSGGFRMYLYHKFSFPYFSGFSWCWWSRGRICNFLMNMENWSDRSQHLGEKHRGYQSWVCLGQGWCRLCPYKPCYL